MQVHRVSYGLLCGEDLESSCLGLLRVTIFRNLGGRDSGVCVDVGALKQRGTARSRLRQKHLQLGRATDAEPPLCEGWLCLSWEKIAQASSVGLDLADNRRSLPTRSVAHPCTP